jgi:2-polyprenyl-3-methyl-5-hydroxy-6-metoxy-1,4-benzoquinol methylase
MERLNLALDVPVCRAGTRMDKSLEDVGNRTYHEAQSHMELLPNYYRWVYGKFAGVLKGRVVELGCGAGLGIASYLSRVDHVHAIDFNDELIQRVRQQFTSDKVTAVQADLLGDWAALNNVVVDAVVMMDVLEHFEDDRTLMRRAAGLICPGGYIVVKVPANKELFSSMDQASGHYRRYDPEDLLALAGNMRLNVKSIRHINPIGALVYRLRNRQKTNFSRTFKPHQLRAINAALPFLSLFDTLSSSYGLSLVAVFQKPER